MQQPIKLDLNTYKRQTTDLCIRKGWDKSSIFLVWLLFMEEIGELASAIRHHTKHFRKNNIKKGNGIDVVMERCIQLPLSNCRYS